ncbi:MAG: ATP-binding cassette domain-containing protein [Acidobacteria bacterium]|nr:ATP-binding cassette domain-containing protein [Acidobacteriota bacterium]
MAVTAVDPVPGAPALELLGVGLRREGVDILRAIDWTVEPGQRWVVLGRNGSGKSSLVRIGSLYLHPSCGTVRLLGHELGRIDVRGLRRRIGLASNGMADMLRADLTPTDVVMTAKNAALEPWWHTYEEADRARAVDCLSTMGVGGLATRSFASLSTGERQRVLLARTLMPEPGIVFLDEPTAGLDLAGREDLVAALGDLAADPSTPATVLVTHHVEEIPEGFTHVLMIGDGTVLRSGPLPEVLTAANLSECFGAELELEHRHGRWWAWSRRDGRQTPK